MKMDSYISSLSYDARFDTLYILFTANNHSYGEEDQSGIIIMRDIQDDSLTGYTIMHFRKKLGDNYPFNEYLPVPIDFAQDVIPRIFS